MIVYLRKLAPAAVLLVGHLSSLIKLCTRHRLTNQKWELSRSQDGCQTNSRRYGDILFIHSVNKIEYFLMISFLWHYDFDITIVGLYNHVFNKSLQKKFVTPLEVGLRYIFYPHRDSHIKYIFYAVISGVIFWKMTIKCWFCGKWWSLYSTISLDLY